MKKNQSLKINLGNIQCSFTWINNHVLIQSKVESVVLSILLEENSNLGITQEYITSLQEHLKPLLVYRKEKEEPE